MEQVACFCDYLLHFTKCGRFLDNMTDNRFLRKHYAQCTNLFPLSQVNLTFFSFSSKPEINRNLFSLSNGDMGSSSRKGVNFLNIISVILYLI
jgi:hypothetical protein